MGQFRRGLNRWQWAGLLALQTAPGPNWWKDLLSLWAPSGTPSRDEGLRLAMRNGSLNSYRRGASIALVKFGPSRAGVQPAYMKIHAHFVLGRGAADVMLSFGTPESPYPGMPALRQWIANSAYRHLPEKWGVDEVAGSNPGLIDLEMTLPSSALRADIVALEEAADGPRLTVWEAKPLNASDLRSMKEEAAVQSQIKAYAEFCKARGAEVTAAYRKHCEGLVRIAHWAGKADLLCPLIVRAQRRLSMNNEVGLALFRGVRLNVAGDRELIPYARNWDEHRAKLSGLKLREAQDPADLALNDE